VLVATSHVWFWQTPSWNWAELWALVVVVGVAAIRFSVPKKAGEGTGNKTAPLFFGLVNGRDGRWSTSKTSAVLWTWSVWFAFITILLHTDGKGVEHQILKQQYLVLMGMPVAAAVVAKGITQNKVDSGKIKTKAPDGVETNPVQGVAQLVTNDMGQPDLLDFQYFGFNLILLLYFFTRFLGHQDLGLPNLPDSLVALSGVSAAGYLGKKGLQQDTEPAIVSIIPDNPAAGTAIKIRCVKLTLEDGESVTVELDGTRQLTATWSSAGSDLTVDVDLPKDLEPKAHRVRVTTSRGVRTNERTITVV